MTAMNTTVDKSIRVDVGQEWSFIDGEVRRVFRITSIKNKYGTLRVYGSYVTTNRFIGASWTVTKLQRGYRKATLERDSQGVTDYTPPPPAPERERPAPKVRLSLPRGMTRKEARRLVDRARVRYGTDAKAIGAEVGFSSVVVEALLEEASAR